MSKLGCVEIEIKNYAKENGIPIIVDEGLDFLELLIRLVKPQKILEIGTAIGYSAIRMAQVCNSSVITMERDEKMYELALNNVKKMALEDQIKILKVDALEGKELLAEEKFDFIFIDAAKAQYEKFFNLYTPLLKSGGLVVCDNMDFHGLVADEENYQNQSRGIRGIIRKLKAFKDFLLSNEDFFTTIFKIGDGMAVAIKK